MIKTPRVVCAAIRNQNDYVICGVRHFDPIMTEQIKKLGEQKFHWEQGFVDARCQFLTREEAFIVAKSHDQIRGRTISSMTELFSEDLY